MRAARVIYVVKLAPNQFLIFLICLDNPTRDSRHRVLQIGSAKGRGMKNLFRFRFTRNQINVSASF